MSEVEPKDKLHFNRRRFLKLTLLSSALSGAEGLLIACGRPQSDATKTAPTTPVVRVINPPPDSTPLVRTTRTELSDYEFSIDVEGGIAGITFDQLGNYAAGRFAHFLDANVLTRPKLPGEYD